MSMRRVGLHNRIQCFSVQMSTKWIKKLCKKNRRIFIQRMGVVTWGAQFEFFNTLLVFALFDTTNALCVGVYGCVMENCLSVSCALDWTGISFELCLYWNMIYAWNNEMTLFLFQLIWHTRARAHKCIRRHNHTHKFIIGNCTWQ